MKSHRSIKMMEYVQSAEHRALLVVYVIVSALVFYAMYLLWQDAPEDTAASLAITTSRQITPGKHTESSLAAQTELRSSAQQSGNMIDQTGDQQVAVNFLLHQLQNSAQGVAVVGVSQQGLANYLGLREGDQITEINGQAVQSVDEVQGMLLNYHPKQTLHFKGKRDAQAMSWTYQAQADD